VKILLKTDKGEVGEQGDEVVTTRKIIAMAIGEMMIIRRRTDRR
jgi:hypothetical protein